MLPARHLPSRSPASRLDQSRTAQYRHHHAVSKHLQPHKSLYGGCHRARVAQPVCAAPADASQIIQNPSAAAAGLKPQQPHQQQQQAQRSEPSIAQQQQQQQQEGLLGPVAPGDVPLEVDRVVERELLDSNGGSHSSWELVSKHLSQCSSTVCSVHTPEQSYISISISSVCVHKQQQWRLRIMR